MLSQATFTPPSKIVKDATLHLLLKSNPLYVKFIAEDFIDYYFIHVISNFKTKFILRVVVPHLIFKNT